MKLFHYLQYGLSVVLIFIGAKMLLPEEYRLPTWAVLTVVVGVLGLSVLASVVFPQNEGHA